MTIRRRLVAALLLVAAASCLALARAGDEAPVPASPAAPAVPAAPSVPAARASPAPGTAAERGYRWLTTKAYVPSTFDRATFEALWTVWPEPERSAAERAAPDARRRMLFERYGFTPFPGDPTRALQYVEDGEGRWSISCLACHAGALAGVPVPGLPNANFAFQSLADDVAAVQARGGRASPSRSMLQFPIPLGETVGTTNAVVFSAALLQFRDKDLNVVFPKKPPHFVHHDLDAPPWWNVRKRERLYVDGFAKKSHRALMQFVMIPTNGAERVKGWEQDFEEVLAYLESIPVPKWPHPVDRALAAQGRPVFDRACARCHGTYGDHPTYPGVDVPIEEIGTDRLRHDAVTSEERALYGASWFTGYDPSTVHVDPKGYVAPPLDGVFASAPYFHDGAVPTLWHVLHPAARPAAWRRRSTTGYDREKVGLDVETSDAVPAGLSGDARRRWFDTSKPGKSAAGHRFPDALSEDEKRAVLEYLKTL